MAKVKSATVRLVLKKCRANKSTGIACKPGNWDLRRECVKNCSNAPVLNKMLLDIKKGLDMMVIQSPKILEL